MSEPPEKPPSRDGWHAPDPQIDDPVAAGTPERPPPYQGTFGGQAPPAAGYGHPGAPLPQAPPTPGYGPPGTPYPGIGAGPPQDMRAGRLVRLAAGILDNLILSVLTTPLVLFSIRWDDVLDAAEEGRTITNPAEYYNLPRLFAGYAVVYLLGIAYFAVLHAKYGQTLGKRACGIRLVRAADLSAVSPVQAIGRQAFVYALTMAGGLALLTPFGWLLWLAGPLDNAWILWDERRQALHDKVAKTVVVKATPWTPNPYARDATSGPGNG
jgi:uncharacterized RDD family membrane protein YckC